MREAFVSNKLRHTVLVFWQVCCEKLVKYPSIYIHVSDVTSAHVHSFVLTQAPRTWKTNMANIETTVRSVKTHCLVSPSADSGAYWKKTKIDGQLLTCCVVCVMCLHCCDCCMSFAESALGLGVVSISYTPFGMFFYVAIIFFLCSLSAAKKT